MKKTWRFPLPVHRFRGILRSLILIFHFRFPLNVSGAQERERLEIKSIASTVCSFRSPDTHTHTPVQTFVKLGRSSTRWGQMVRSCDPYLFLHTARNRTILLR